jgi:hypothetical protein
MNYTIDNDYEWFKVNRAALYRQYPNKFLVIRDQKVLGAYDDDRDAIENTRLPLGEYLLPDRLDGPDARVERIYAPNLVTV